MTELVSGYIMSDGLTIRMPTFPILRFGQQAAVLTAEDITFTRWNSVGENKEGHDDEQSS